MHNAGVAAGSTRAALTLHFAKQNNAADVSAKEGTQVYSHATAIDTYPGKGVRNLALDSLSAAGDCNNPGWDAAWHGFHTRL